MLISSNAGLARPPIGRRRALASATTLRCRTSRRRSRAARLRPAARASVTNRRVSRRRPSPRRSASRFATDAAHGVRRVRGGARWAEDRFAAARRAPRRAADGARERDRRAPTCMHGRGLLGHPSLSFFTLLGPRLHRALWCSAQRAAGASEPASRTAALASPPSSRRGRPGLAEGRGRQSGRH